MTIPVSKRDFMPEFTFATSRSGGKGGQNVNKVETKVELYFNVVDSQLLSDIEKERILKKLKNRINKENTLVICSQTERTQLGNKNKVIGKFYALIVKALTTEKPRLKVSIPKSLVEYRLKEKRINSAKKASRGNRSTENNE